MFDLFKAEWQKVIGNRWKTGLMMWIFPCGAAVVTVVLTVIVLTSPGTRQALGLGVIKWTQQMIGVWQVPNNPLGRALLLGFAAIVFAGEYQWQTLKNIVPSNSRTVLLMVKFLTVAAFVVIAFLLTSIIWGAGMGIVVKAAGHSYGPAISAEVVTKFLKDYSLQAVLAFVSVVIGAAYVMLGGMITKSILGSLLIGVGVKIAEGVSVVPLVLVSRLLDMDWIIKLYRITPTYNLNNVNSWILRHRPLRLPLIPETNSLTISLIILTAWMVSLVGLSLYLFHRQDIKT